MSDDIAARKDIYANDFEAFKVFLNRVYFLRMSEKMIVQVFRAFWKFTFVKTEAASSVPCLCRFQLLDTRHIINTYARRNSSEIEELSSLILASIQGLI
jgi:hypothetical protein